MYTTRIPSFPFLFENFSPLSVRMCTGVCVRSISARYIHKADRNNTFDFRVGRPWTRLLTRHRVQIVTQKKIYHLLSAVRAHYPHFSRPPHPKQPPPRPGHVPFFATVTKRTKTSGGKQTSFLCYYLLFAKLEWLNGIRNQQVMLGFCRPPAFFSTIRKLVSRTAAKATTWNVLGVAERRATNEMGRGKYERKFKRSKLH